MPSRSTPSRWEVRGSPIAVVDDIVTEPTDGLDPVRRYPTTGRWSTCKAGRSGTGARSSSSTVEDARRQCSSPVLTASCACPRRATTWRCRPTAPTCGRGCSTCGARHLGCSPRPGPTKARRGAMTAPGWRTRRREEAKRSSTSRVFDRRREKRNLQSGNDVSTIKSFSADDQYVLVSDFSDIFRVKSDGSAGRKPWSPRARARPPRHASPDGKWLAFQSDDTDASKCTSCRTRARADDNGCPGTVVSSRGGPSRDGSCAIGQAQRHPRLPASRSGLTAARLARAA